MFWFLIGLVIVILFGYVIIGIITAVFKFVLWIISGILQLIFGNQNE